MDKLKGEIKELVEEPVIHVASTSAMNSNDNRQFGVPKKPLSNIG